MDLEDNEIQSIFDKHGLFFIGKRRFYKLNFLREPFDLTNTSPIGCTIEGEDLMADSWSSLILSVTKYLRRENPGVDFLNFVPSWKNYKPFADSCLNNFYKEIDEDLYLYLNFTAIHAFMFIKELLELCCVDLLSSELVVHRSPYAEPKEIVEILKQNALDQFVEFLNVVHGIDEERAKKIFKNIDTRLNPICAKVSMSYNDLFLFDNKLMYAMIKSKFFPVAKKDPLWSSPHNIALVRKYLDYLTEYYQYAGY